MIWHLFVVRERYRCGTPASVIGRAGEEPFAAALSARTGRSPRSALIVASPRRGADGIVARIDPGGILT